MFGRLPTLLAGALMIASCGEPAPPEGWRTPSPALWLIENEDGEHEGWLFGTIHALPDRVKWKTPALQRAIDRSGTLVLEISPEDHENSSAILRELATTPSLPPLAERIDPAYRDDLAALLEIAGLDSDDFAATETWAAALTLANATSSGDFSNGVDRALGKEFEIFLVLEGAEAQLSIFDTLPEEEQADLLEAIIAENANHAETDRPDLAKAWLAGDIEAIAREADTGMLADPELRAALLTNRNLKWVDAIHERMQRDDLILIAVGAAHMTGDEGLPALLGKKGYTVTRVQ